MSTSHLVTNTKCQEYITLVVYTTNVTPTLNVNLNTIYQLHENKNESSNRAGNTKLNMTLNIINSVVW